MIKIVGCALGLVVSAFLGTTGAKACLGTFAEYSPLFNVSIPSSAAPVVAKVTIVAYIDIEAKAPKRAIVLARVDESIAGTLPSEVKIAVRIQGLCDQGPQLGESGYVKGEMKGDELWAISASCSERLGRQC